MSPGRGRPLRSRRMSLTRFCSCRSRCRLSFHMRDRLVSDRDCSRYRWCRARIGAGRLVRSAMGRLLGRGLGWCWFPIGKLRRSCICYDRCRRRLVCGQLWIGKLTGLKHVVKSRTRRGRIRTCRQQDSMRSLPQFLPSAVRLRIPRRRHRPTASMAGALEWRDPCSVSEQKEVSCFCGLP
jgi:hypothetical protein